MASHIKRARIALVLIGILYAWDACRSYDHLRPWRDGSMFDTAPTGELGRLIDLAYFIIVFTGIASLAHVVLAAIAGKKTTLAICAATAIFVAHTALGLYLTDGRYSSYWLWPVIAIVLGIGIRAAYKANQLRKPRQLPEARVVA